MSEIEVAVSGHKIEIGDNVRELEYPVKRTLQYNDIVVVLIEPPSQVEVRDNIVSFDNTGEKLWRIEPVTTENRRGSLVYVDISEIDGKLIAHNWNESTYEVDPETGAVKLDYNPRSG